MRDPARPARVHGWTVLAVGAMLVASGCRLTTSSIDDAADVRGTWEFTGTQVSPRLELSGEFVITRQVGAQIEGTAAWEARDLGGGVQLNAGAIFGRAIGRTDVDFDVMGESADRRHVARLVSDTMIGVWVEGVGGASGEFRAVRTSR